MANKTGNGYFKKGADPRRNMRGAPPRGQSWQETVKRITNMTREEAIEYVGENTKLGKLLRELSPEIPIKDAMIFMAIIAFGREPNAKMFAALTDREEGKPKEQVDITSGGEPITQKVDDERFDRAVSALADAVRESVSRKGSGSDGAVDTPK